MRFFIDFGSPPASAGTEVNETPAYVELVTRVPDDEPPGTSYLYVTPEGQGSYSVLACWNNELDHLAELVNDPKLGDKYMNAIVQTFPTLGELIMSGNAGRFGEGAVVRARDPDDYEEKWFVGTVVGNIAVETLEDLQHPRFAAAYETVLGRSLAALYELVNNEVSAREKLKLVSAGAWKGYIEGVETSNRWMARLQGLGAFVPR
jgi:hypothetical protein